MAVKKNPADLTALREQIEATTREVEAVLAAPIPCAEAEANLTARLDQLASLYDPTPFLSTFTRAPDAGLDAVAALIVDPRDPQMHRAYEAAIHRDRLLEVWRARLRAQYEEHPELTPAAVPIAARPARLAELRAQLRDLELREEALIIELARSGQQVDRREDASPSILFDASIIALEEAATA